MIEQLDSETFYYGSESHSSHQGRHSIIRKLLPSYPITEPGQVLLTCHEDTFYIWKGMEGKGLGWSEWAQLDFERIENRFNEHEKELPQIQIEHNGFVARSEDGLGCVSLGSEIEIVPRGCYPICDGWAERWTIDLKLPTGSETVTFTITGQDKIQWFNKRAILDEPMTIALRNFELKDVVI